VTRRELTIVCLSLLAAAAMYAAPVFMSPTAVLSGDMVKDFDWLKIAAFEHFARANLLEHFSLPLWNPFFGGGYPQLAHPEDGSLSPLMLPSYVLGEVLGMKVQLILALFLGGLGTFLVARRTLRLGLPGAMLAALGLILAGWMTWRVHYGWPMHFGYYLFPLAFFFTWRAVTDTRWLLAAAAVMVVILQQIAQGLPFFFLYLFLWAVAADIAGRKTAPLGRRTKLVFGLAALTVLGGALKVAGLLRLLSANLRAVVYGSYNPGDHFYTGPLDWGRFIVGEADVFYKNIGLGPWLALLALIGLVVAFRRLWPLLIPTVVLVWIGLGPNAPLDLFGLLHKLPIFGSMHWPMKYTNFFVAFTLVLAAGAAVDFAFQRAPEKWRLALYAVALVPLVPMALTHMGLFDRSFTEPMADLTPAPAFRQVAAFQGAPRGAERPRAANMYRLMLQNEGTVDWDGDLLLPEHAVPAFRIEADGSRRTVEEYAGEAFLTGEGNVDEICWVGNGFVVAGTANEATRLVVNQNFDTGWRDAERHNGLVSRAVEAGPFTQRFLYRPTWFVVGLLVQVLSWLLAAAWLWRGRGKAAAS
jgi:hypothetical protein